MLPLNIFYQEPDPDRWFKYDRYPRAIIRKILRGPQRPGGVMTVAINLLKGLDKLGVQYRFNDFKYAEKHPEELVCIIGKPQVLFDRQWKNPIIFGAGIFSHPYEHTDIFKQYPNLKKILVPGEWMRQMFEPYYGDKVISWPVGIDTEYWKPPASTPQKNVLIYDKVMWDYDTTNKSLIKPTIDLLETNGLSYEYIKYGHYKPHELMEKVKNCAFAIFLCQHETQGLAYQQILSTGKPVLAWDGGGFWQDPSYYPDKVKFKGVSSVPYWSEECGMRFKDINDLYTVLPEFISAYKNDKFNPRNYIMHNLSLEVCAAAYMNIVKNEM